MRKGNVSRKRISKGRRFENRRLAWAATVAVILVTTSLLTNLLNAVSPSGKEMQAMAVRVLRTDPGPAPAKPLKSEFPRRRLAFN